MQSEGWPAINCDRFESESLDAYKRRLARIADIMTGFRMGRYGSDVADRMEEELISLQEFGPDAPEQRFFARRALAPKHSEGRVRRPDALDETRRAAR